MRKTLLASQLTPWLTLLRTTQWRTKDRLLALLMAIGLVAAAGPVQAQVSQYTFGQSTGTYTPITGGTVAATATAGSNFSLDNANYTLAAGTLPFTFTFDGTGYTGLRINSNGYLTFGTTSASTSGYTPISATTGYAGAVSAYAQDLVGDATAASLGEIRYQTIGTAPSRTFVVQFTNFKRYVSGILADNLNFQIRLNETSNTIDFVYNVTATAATSSTQQVGLRGASNTSYVNRTTTTDWSASTPGGSNSASMTTSGTVKPAPGLTYTFTPPACAAPSSLAVGSITTTSASISFTAGAGNTSYAVTYTPSGGTATTVTPAPTASPVALSGLTPNTTYTVSVVGNCAGGATSSASTTTFTTLAPPPANDLCANAAAITCGQTLSGTTVGATNTGEPTSACGGTNTPSASPSVFYSFLGTGDIVTVSTCGAGTTIDTELFVYTGTCGALVCLDGNDDFSGCSANTAASQVTFTSVAGTTYYFMVQRYSSGSATGAFAINLTCTPPPACATPTNLAVSNITTTSASIGFTPGNGNTSYTVTYTPSGGTATTVTPAPTASPVQLTGLTPNTSYTVSVVGNCAGGATTSAVTTTFSTPVAAPGYVISRSTGISYSSIQGTGTSFTGWSSATSTDDNVSGSTAIGFNFQYLGQTATNFRVSTNGWLSFNTAQVPSGTDNYSNNLGNSSANTMLAPFWEDLVLQGNGATAAALAAAKLKYQLDGTAPNRVLTVEWAEMETFNNAGPNLNFQVKLYEGTNAIEYVYGNMSGFDGSNNFTYTYSLGLSGPLASSGQYLAQQVPNSTYFLNSNATTANTGANGLNIVPSCNSSIRFVPGTFAAGTPPTAAAPSNDEPSGATALTVGTTPPTDFCAVYSSANATASSGIAACSATTPGTADDDVWYSFTLPAVSSVTVTLRNSGGYDGVLQLFSGAPGSLTAVACVNGTGSGLTENYINPTLAAGTYYVRVYSADTGSGTNGTFVLAAYATPAPPANDECTAAVGLTPGTTTCTPLAGTTIGATASSGAPTCSATTPGNADDDVWYSFVATGPVGTLTVQGNSGFDPVVQLYSGACASLNSLGCINGTSTSGAEVGSLTGLSVGQTYYVRVYHAGSGSGSGSFSICVVMPTCTDPSALAVGSITTTTASLSFTPGTGAVDYVVTYTPQGGTATTVTPAPTASPVALSGLTPNTQYTVTLQQNCSGGQQSGVLSTTFTTLPSPPANDDCAGATPITSIGVGSCGTAVAGTNLGATASSTTGTPDPGCASYLGGDVWYSLTVPANGIVQVETNQGSGTSISDTGLALYSGSCGNLTLISCSDDEGTGAFSLLRATGLTPGSTIYARVWEFSNDATGTFTICAQTDAACAAPSALAAGSVTSTSASLSFTAGGGNTSYTVTYTPQGGTATTVTPAPTASPVVLTGLTPNTQYSVSIIGNCSGGATSTAATTTFTTLVPAPANDDCATATPITSIGVGSCGTAVAGTNAGATASSTTGTPAPGCASYLGGDVWYSLTVPANGIVQVETSQGSGTSISDTGLALYSGSCGSLTLISCNDDISSGTNNFSRLRATGLTPGSTIYARVWEYSNDATGTFSICAQTDATVTNLTVSSSQTMPGGTYNNVTITGTGALYLTSNLVVNGALVVQSGGTLATSGTGSCAIISGPGSFTLQDGATFGICSPDGLSSSGATGTVQVSGTRTFNPGATYIYNSTTGAQVTGPGLPTQVRNLTAGNAGGLTLSQALAVKQELVLINSNLNTNGQPLTLLSDATGTALVNNQGGVVQGTATVQRWIDPSLNAGPGYRHYSAPISNTTVADLATGSFSPVVNPAYNASSAPNLVTPFPTVFGYDESRVLTSPATTYSTFDKGWFSPSALSSPMEVGRGYTVNIPASQTVDFSGTLVNGTVNRSLTRAGGVQGGLHLVGNPYPSPLDWTQMTLPAGLDNAMYVYQSTGQYTGGYRSYVNGVGNPLVSSGQGFFVRLSPGSSSAQLNFTNAARITSFATQQSFNRGVETRPLVQLTLRGAGSPLVDDAYVYFENGATAGVDARYDALKLQRNSGGMPSVYALAAGTELSINGLPQLLSSTVVPLGVNVPTVGAYTFEAAQLLNLTTAGVYLHDAVTGQDIDLRRQPTYSFTAGSTALPGRFELRFEPQRPTASTAGLTAASVTLFPNPAHQRVTLLVPAVASAKQVTATLLNSLGQVVATQTVALPAAGAQLTFDVAPLATGVYTVRLQAGDATVAKRLVVE